MVTAAARILIADDEDTFARSTADLLRREGYACDVVPDAQGARDALAIATYDLLVADIRMPGNHDLEFIREMPTLAPGLPVVVVTAYPSLNSAVASVNLPVSGYLLKPLDVDVLLERVREAVGRQRVVRAVEAQQARLESWLRELGDIRDALRAGPREAAVAPVESLATLTLRQAGEALADIAQLRGVDGVPDACSLAGCSRRGQHLHVLRDVIDTLRRTKGAFRSKELGALRHRLEQIVARATA